MAAGGLDGADRVCDQATVVMVPGGLDASGHEPRVGGTAGCAGVRRVAALPDTALSTRVHDEMRESSRAGDEPVGGETTAAAVADVLDDAGYGAGAMPRNEEPCLDRLATEAVERDVVNVLEGKAGVVWLERGGDVMAAGIGERR